MGVWSYIKQKFNTVRYAQALNGYTPIFSQFGQDIYASDIVQSVIDCIVTEMCKLQPMHIIKKDRDSIPVNDSLQKVLNNPNDMMTTHDFISKIMWNLFLNYNSFIYPVYDVRTNADGSETRTYKALYPLQPNQASFVEDAAGNLFVKMRFGNGFETTLPYDSLIHVRYRYSVNEYMGGNEAGQPDNDALLKLLSMNNSLMDGVLNAMKTSFAINGIMKYNTLLDGPEMKAAIEAFNQQLQNNASGIIGVDLKGEYIPLSRKIQAVDPETLKFIDSRILRKYGVSMAILTGDYTKAQYQAFYQKILEPIIINLTQAFKKTLFTQRQKDLGHDILFMTEPLLFLDTSQVVEVIRLLGDSGTLYENEKRVAIGFPPDPALEGVRMQSLNYVNVELAAQYQTGKKEEVNDD